MVKRMTAFLLCTLLLCSLCACGSTNDENPYESLMGELQASSTPEPDEGRVLTVAIWQHSFWYEAHARAYTALHPDVTIQFQKLSSEYVRADSELAVQLMAGSGPDVIATYTAPAFLQNGHMVDLYPFMENDPDFHEEDYFMDVVSAMEMDGKLYAFPYGFVFTSLFAMRKDLDPEAARQFETAEQVTYEDMISWFEHIGSPSGVIYEGFDPRNALSYYYDAAIDLQDKSCNFPGSPLGPMLERAKALPAPHVTYTPDGGTITSDSKMSTAEFTDLTNQDYRYLFLDCSILHSSPQVLFPYEGSIFTKPRFISSASGKVMFDAGESLSITDSCEDTELAWDFIKFCIADKTEPYDWFSYNTQSINFNWSVGFNASVNRTTYAAQCTFLAQAKYEEGIENAGMTPIGEKEQVIADAVSFLMALPDQLEANASPYAVVDDIIWPDLYLYFTDQQNIDVTLENIQSKVTLYLNE